MKQPELTDRQKELFEKLTKLKRKVVIGVIDGLQPIEAYRQGGGSAKTLTAQTTSVHQIMTNRDVKAFLDSVQQNQLSSAILSQTEALELLTTDARNHELQEEYKDLARVRHSAIKQISEISRWVDKGTNVNTQVNIGVLTVPEDKSEEDILEEYKVVSEQ